jgi:LmbE family N-acetylglucosaminyl deacetylase
MHISHVSNLRTFLSALILLLPVLLFAQKNKVILAVFAHPDDESSVSPVLAKYAALGAKVYLAVATDGRYGRTGHYPVTDPDSLAAVRRAEINCTAEVLGIQPPVLMGLHDQLRMKDGMDSLTAQMAAIRERVTELFITLKPDIVITWGPSGLTYHPDHRAVSDVVTEVFLKKQWPKPTDLLYTAVPTGTFDPVSIPLATVDSNYLNVRIAITRAEHAKARKAWDCHKSQYTKEMVDELELLFWTAQKGVFYFQSYRSAQTRRNQLFTP